MGLFCEAILAVVLGWLPIQLQHLALLIWSDNFYILSVLCYCEGDVILYHENRLLLLLKYVIFTYVTFINSYVMGMPYHRN